MNISISVPLPAYKADVALMTRQAAELGFKSFWCAKQPIMPVHSPSRFPGSADGIIPESHSHFVDPFVVLARVSSTTTKIQLGTSITIVPERTPLLLAKAISTLDLFSVAERSTWPRRAQHGSHPGIVEQVYLWTHLRSFTYGGGASGQANPN